MPKKKDAHDSLLPLIQSLDTLWSDYLSPLLDSGASGRNAQWVYQRVTEAEVPASLAVTVVHRVHLAEPLNKAIDASLVFYDFGEDPLNSHATQHVVQSELLSLFQFLLDWAAGEIKPDAAEIRIRRESFFRVRNLVASVRFTLSRGRHGKLVEETMNETDRRVEAYIRQHQPIQGQAMCEELNIDYDHFRARIVPKLKRLRGLQNSRNRDGYSFPKGHM